MDISVPAGNAIIEPARVHPPPRVEYWAKVASLITAACAAAVGIWTLRAGIDKFEAEAEKARLETQQKRMDVAEKSRDDKLDLSANAVSGRGDGWYVITATLSRSNAGVRTMVVHHIRFACRWASLKGIWSDSVKPNGAAATWVTTPVTPPQEGLQALKWQDLGEPVQYPLGGEFQGAHRSNFGDGGARPPEQRYQPNGVGVYMSGETVVASHQMLARFEAESVVGCEAEVEYSVDDRSRDDILRHGLQADAGRYVQPFVKTTLVVCGTEGYGTCAFKP